MKYDPGHPTKRRSVAKRYLFLSLCLAAVAALLFTPLIGAGQDSDRNRPFAFHGRNVHTALHSDVARWANSEDQRGLTEPQPVPIPGGLLLPPLIHVFAPGPVDQGFQGFDIEPTVIHDFKGFTAIGYPGGTNTVQDSNGNSYDLVTDMRVFQGEYVAADGSHHRGTFVFI